MRNESEVDKRARRITVAGRLMDHPLHPAWRVFIRYCTELQHGEIELLKIQDGLPMIAETVKKKVKFAP